MMVGTRETFGYTQCADCLCLQIDEVPQDLARHYAGDYYSYAPAQARPNPLKRWAAAGAAPLRAARQGPAGLADVPAGSGLCDALAAAV